MAEVKKHSIWGMSSLWKRFRCPGSAHIESAQRDGTTYSGDRAANLGTTLHALIEERIRRGDYVLGDQGEEPLIDWCLERVQEILGNRGEGEVYLEDRVEIDEKVWGTADKYVVFREDDEIVGFDWKFGWMPPAEEVDYIWQTGGYAEGAMKKHGISRATWYVVHPRTRSLYRVDVNQGELIPLIQDVVAKSEPLDAPLSAGSWCRLCAGNGVCPASQALQRELVQRVETLPMENMSTLLDMLPSVRSAVRAVEKKAREMLESDPESIPGWMIEDRPGGREIRDLLACYEKVQSYVSQEEFLGCCKASISALERLVAGRLSPDNRSEGRRLFSTLVRDVVDQGTRKHLTKRSATDGE